MSQQQPGQTLASHLIAQTISSVQLLESLGLIQHADAEVIRSKLPNPYTAFPSLVTAASTGSTCSLPSSPSQNVLSPSKRTER